MEGVQLDGLGAVVGQGIQKLRQGVLHYKALWVLGTGKIQFIQGKKDSF